MANPNNGPISVSAPGASLINASGSDITFNTKNPFMKLDSSTNISFQNITLFLAKNTPDSSTPTTVYTVPHGYKYVPSCWMLYQRTVGLGDQSGGTSNRAPAYGYDGGTFVVQSAADSASNAHIGMSVDATNVYITVTKFQNAVDFSWINVIGYFLHIRLYVFANDLSGTDLPSQP